MSRVKPLVGLGCAAAVLAGAASAQHPLTTIEIFNNTNSTMTLTSSDPGLGFYDPNPGATLPPGEVLITHRSSSPAASGGRIDYRECRLFFSKVSQLNFLTGERTWPTFNATATDLRTFDNIDCQAQILTQNVFNGAFRVRFTFTD